MYKNLSQTLYTASLIKMLKLKFCAAISIAEVCMPFVFHLFTIFSLPWYCYVLIYFLPCLKNTMCNLSYFRFHGLSLLHRISSLHNELLHTNSNYVPPHLYSKQKQTKLVIFFSLFEFRLKVKILTTSYLQFLSQTKANCLK